MLKPLTVGIMVNCEKLLERREYQRREYQRREYQRWEYRTILPVSSETCMRIRKQQLELDTEQQTGSQ